MKFILSIVNNILQLKNDLRATRLINLNESNNLKKFSQ